MKPSLFKNVFAAALLCVLCAPDAQACKEHETAGEHAAHADHATHAAPAQDYYAADMKAMHESMMIAPTGDADMDFVRGMIPHHEGAVAMARTLKQHGADPELSKLADEIIAAQEKEIAFMRDWIARHSAMPAAATTNP